MKDLRLLICQICTVRPELDPRVIRFTEAFVLRGWRCVLLYWERNLRDAAADSFSDESEWRPIYNYWRYRGDRPDTRETVARQTFATFESLRRPSFWVMPVLLFQFYLKSLSAVIKLHPDICVAHQLDTLPVALLSKLLQPRLKVVFDNEDVYSLMIYQAVPRHLNTAIRRLEYFLLRRADLCIFPNEAMRDSLLTGGTSRTLIIPNIPEEAFTGVEGPHPRGITPSQGFVIVYYGLIAKHRGLETLIGAVNELAEKGERIHCVLIGDGPLVDELKELASRLGTADRVEFTGRVARIKVPELLVNCDASAVLNTKKDPMNWIGNPNKLFESMMLGIPVIASNFGEIGRIVSEANCGLLVNPEDVKSVAAAIRRLIANSELRTELSLNGRRWIQTKYSAERLGTTLVEAFERLNLTKE